MAVRGAIHENETHDYQFRFLWSKDETFDGVSDTDRSYIATERIQWGITDVYVQVRVDIQYDAGTTTWTYEITLSSPFTTDTVVSGTGEVSSLTSRIEWDALSLAVSGESCDYSLSSDELRWYLKLNAGTENLEETIASPGDSGTGYDRRLNIHARTNPAPSINPAPSLCVGEFDTSTTSTCTITSVPTEYELRLISGVTTGRRWYDDDAAEWKTDAVEIHGLAAGEAGCLCFYPYSGLNIPDSDSWTISSSAEFLQEKAVTDLGEKTYTCVIVPANSWIRHEYKISTRDYIGAWPWFAETPASSALLPYQITTTAACGIDEEEDITTGTETSTKCEQTVSVYNYDLVDYCWINISGPSPCPEPPGLEPDPPNYQNTVCCFNSQSTYVWTVAPPCTSAGACLSTDVSDGGRHVLGFHRDGTFWLKRSDNLGAVWEEIDSGIMAECNCVFFDKQTAGSPLFVWLLDGGQVDRYRTDDEGGTYSVATTVFASATTAMDSVIGRNGLVYQYRIQDQGDSTFDVKGKIEDRAGNVVVAEFTAIEEVDETAVTVKEFPTGGGKHQIALWVNIGGAETRYLSDDGVTFA